MDELPGGRESRRRHIRRKAQGARRMTPHKSEACRAEIEMLLEYDMIEPSKSPWACGVVMAKKKGGSLDFVATFVT